MAANTHDWAQARPYGNAADAPIVEQGATMPLGLIYVLFFISGFPALIYQIVWQRALFTIYGVNVESVTIVVSAFMLGLGLGSLMGGAISKRPALPMLAVFGCIELGIGCYGAASLHIFHWAGTYTAGVSLPATGLLSFVLVLLPTTLMGATLPILVTHLVRSSSNVGSSVGMLYFVNTLGSAMACIAAATYLMRMLGESGCVTAAAAINFTIGGAALVGHLITGRSARAVVAAEPEAPARLGAGLFPFPLAMALVCLSGFIALSYEILWYRAYAFASGGQASAFALLLGAYLEGVAFGSLFSKVLCTKLSRSEDRSRVLLVISALLVVANVGGFLVAPALAWTVQHVQYVVSFPFVAISAGLLGAVFPLLTHIAVAPDGRAGERLSRLYLSNIVGSTLGTFLVGFILMDYWSMGQISVFLLLLGLAMAAAIQMRGARSGTRLAWAGGVGALALAGVLAAPAIFDTIYERMLYKGGFEPEKRFTHLLESRSGVVAVDKHDIVFGGGMYDGRFNTGLTTDGNWIVRAYAIGAFHPNPRRALMIGLSSGSWAQVIANEQGLEHLTIVEINPSYLDLIPQYPQVASVLHNSKVDIVIDDGRRWLARNQEKFDLIVMNSSFHWRAHMSNLLSVDFLKMVRQHLETGGAFYYNTTGSGEVQLTGATVFPYALRVMNFLALSDQPLRMDREAWRAQLAAYRIDGKPVLDLSRDADRRTLERVAALSDLEFGDSIRRRCAGKRIITDDNMGTEWTDWN